MKKYAIGFTVFTVLIVSCFALYWNSNTISHDELLYECLLASQKEIPEGRSFGKVIDNYLNGFRSKIAQERVQPALYGYTTELSLYADGPSIMANAIPRLGAPPPQATWGIFHEMPFVGVLDIWENSHSFYRYDPPPEELREKRVSMWGVATSHREQLKEFFAQTSYDVFMHREGDLFTRVSYRKKNAPRKAPEEKGFLFEKWENTEIPEQEPDPVHN